jgi:hypothetical protein
MIRLGEPEKVLNEAEKPAQGNPETLQMLSMIRDLSTRVEEVATRQTNPAAQFNPMDQMTTMLGMMKMFKDVMGPAPESQTPDLLKQLETFKKLSEIFKGDSDSDREDNLFSVLKPMVDTFGKPIAQAAEKMLEQQPQNMGTMQPFAVAGPIAQPENIPVQNPIISTTAQNVNEGSPEMFDKIIKEKLKPYIADLVIHAKAGHSAVTYAEVIADNIDDSQIGLLLDRDNPIAYLISIDPGIV